MEGNIVSPGFIDTQINGAYGFDFSVYEGDPDAYRRGLASIAEKIVETGVTSYVLVTFVLRTLLNYNSRYNPGLFLLSSYVLFPGHHHCVDQPLIDPGEITLPNFAFAPSSLRSPKGCSFVGMACRGPFHTSSQAGSACPSLYSVCSERVCFV
jgi:hypothetical protein